ncbi:MAG: DNA integrity scanning diadenylate cyclase DisA [Actinomycetota bacterium]|nr:DNA integrity scanning diadenylate cyclase DisA [Actinomycetota bacterium]
MNPQAAEDALGGRRAGTRRNDAVVADDGDALLEALALVAPGTRLRQGLDRILQAKRGAIVVFGDDPAVLAICTGGFVLDTAFTPERLSELAKMDGAIILTADASRIARANVHLTPRASIPTSETGTRHRTAERVARSLDVPVVTVSESMSTITVYRGAARHMLQQPGRLIDRAAQAIAAVERFKSRFDLALALLSTLEVEDSVSVNDVVAVLQPGEMVVRFTEEVQGYLVELGEDGRLIRLQIEELGAGVEETLRLVVLDYVVTDDAVLDEGVRGAADADATVVDAAVVDAAVVGGAGKDAAVDGERDERERSGAGWLSGNGRRPSRDAGRDPRASALRARADEALAALHELSHEELMGRTAVAAVLGLDPVPGVLDLPAEARGYRLLHRLPRVSEAVIERIVERFATLPRLMEASLADLEKVGGVGEAKARSVKDGLSRMVEASILERYE